MFEKTNRVSAVLGALENASRTDDFVPAERWLAHADGQKIFLPRGTAESRFAPRQYYYLASKTGVVPHWAVAAQDRAAP